MEKAKAVAEKAQVEGLEVAMGIAVDRLKQLHDAKRKHEARGDWKNAATIGAQAGEASVLLALLEKMHRAGEVLVGENVLRFDDPKVRAGGRSWLERRRDT